jgi:rhamnosyltransferase
LAAGKSIEASVLIPTYNAGSGFEEVLEAIAGQETSFAYELLLVDSGSTDGTLDLARRHSARVSSIPKSEFSHGGARNRGISDACGEYVAMTVQDAIPADEKWLQKLVENLQEDEAVAGVYSRQIPRPDCNPFSRFALERHFTNSPERRVQAIESPERYEALTPMQRLETITFDDVSSCVRRSVWREHPFRPVSFGEDLDWSERVLKAGYKIVYEPASAVVHSHNRSAFYEMKRAYVAHKLLSRMVGLRLLPTFGHLRRLLPGVIRRRLKLARNAGGGPRLYAQAVALSLGDQTGVYLGGLAGADPDHNPVPGFVDRRLSRGV